MRTIAAASLGLAALAAGCTAADTAVPTRHAPAPEAMPAAAAAAPRFVRPGIVWAPEVPPALAAAPAIRPAVLTATWSDEDLPPIPGAPVPATESEEPLDHGEGLVFVDDAPLPDDGGGWAAEGDAAPLDEEVRIVEIRTEEIIEVTTYACPPSVVVVGAPVILLRGYASACRGTFRAVACAPSGDPCAFDPDCVYGGRSYDPCWEPRCDPCRPADAIARRTVTDADDADVNVTVIGDGNTVVVGDGLLPVGIHGDPPPPAAGPVADAWTAPRDHAPPAAAPPALRRRPRGIGAPESARRVPPEIAAAPREPTFRRAPDPAPAPVARPIPASPAVLRSSPVAAPPSFREVPPPRERSVPPARREARERREPEPVVSPAHAPVTLRERPAPRVEPAPVVVRPRPAPQAEPRPEPRRPAGSFGNPAPEAKPAAAAPRPGAKEEEIPPPPRQGKKK